jgi:alpha-L-rhamnosidase
MKRVFVFLLLLLSRAIAPAQSLSVTNLQCEYRSNPAGVESAAPRLSWQLQTDRRSVLQQAYRVLVADSKATLDKGIGNLWDSKRVNSSASIQVPYTGKALKAATTYYWKVMVWDNKGIAAGWSEAATWSMGLLSKADWKGAQWIAYDILPDSNRIVPAAHGSGKKEWGKRKDILPMLRKEFAVKKTVKQASLYISGLGHFEATLNGKKIGDHFLDPGWTAYDKHALYVTFDVTSQLTQGANAIGVMLGNGFFYVPSERYRKLTGAFGYPKMISRLLIEYTDGATENIVSDASWKAAPSPVIYSSIYGGEDYDATLEQKGWDQPGFAATSWQQALVTTGPVLNAQSAEPLKVMETFKPVTSKEITPGTWMYDMGQNMSGIPRVTLQGKKGDTVKIITGELIKEDGSVNQKATGSPSYYLYILKGEGTETWQPQFTYYGYRYVQVERSVPANAANPQQLPVLVSVEGLHTRNAAKRAGHFSSSNELFNKTDKLIDWAVKSNMASVFTDCPHREKLGWLEEAHLVGCSVRFCYDIAALSRKVVKDMQHAQTPEGLIPEIAPEFVQFGEPFRDSPEWGSNSIIMPWYLYLWYGDKEVLAESYSMMGRYVDYLKKKSDHHILMQGLGDWFDLGPKSPGVSQLTPQGLTATAVYHYDLTILADVARLLGKPQDALKYTQWAKEVKAAFNNKWFNKDTKQYGTNSQAANAIAIYMGLIDPADKAAVVDNIVKDIRSRNNSLTAGDIGYRYLLKVLHQEGRSDVIYDMNNRDDVPGYGYQLAHGATALTESWAALPVVSNNHFMLGHIMEWFYAGLAGIETAPDAVAFKKIMIKPEPVGDVTTAKADYQSPYGAISTEWKKEGSGFTLQVQVPANATALVYLPATKANSITESGKAITANKDLILVRYEKDRAVFSIGSGNYTFVVK